ncbi:MAG: UDP-N-acetylmuramyl-tripeptide synthetase [bacterium]|nr:UDP-N-acetylmuramyl-tripeptide synthetase [bacterium]
MNNLKGTVISRLFRTIKLPYHYSLALLGAIVYGFPSRKLNVIAVTGTKGKSSVVELVNALLEEAGYTTASASTIHFKIGDKKERNLHKMTMPGRFFLQSFLRKAVNAGCTHAVIEMTSEGARQFRHKFIALDALIFTNLAPEHIESHGSYENYVRAKVSIARALELSPKKDKVLVVNGDDKEAHRFMEVFTGTKQTYGEKDAGGPVVTSEGVSFNWNGVRIESSLPGEFNKYNILAATTYAKAVGTPLEKIQAGIKKVKGILGRAQKIEGADFSVIVDYAHTPDSLEKFYQTYAGKYKRCILGNTGGGRDTWKRPVMAGIAEKYCDEVILTNEDPYDEDPEKIIREMAVGMKHKEPLLILDRRAAIRTALQKSSKGDYVLITGKGTDPYIMGPKGAKEVWDDATVVKEELSKILADRKF